MREWQGLTKNEQAVKERGGCETSQPIYGKRLGRDHGDIFKYLHDWTCHRSIILYRLNRYSISLESI
jgi:hypothetical protein